MRIICLLLLLLLLTPPVYGQQVEDSINQHLQAIVEQEARREDSGPEVWILARGEHTTRDRAEYAMGVGIKWPRFQVRMMTWPQIRKHRLDVGVRIR